MGTEDIYGALKVEAQPLGFFETPIAYAQLKESEKLIYDLERSIHKNKASNAGLSRSNVGSWHSDTNMMQWGGEAANKLANTAISIAKRMSHFQDSSPDAFEWKVSMWANVTSPNGLNHIHAHPGNLWAAVFYINMGRDPSSKEDVGGSLYVEDPRFPMAAMHNTGFRMKDVKGKQQAYQVDLNLQEGNLVVFPAWMRHGVRTYRGAGERISVALNIDAVPKP